MFHLNELSRISDPTLKASVDQTEKLSLGQAKYLSSLHNLTMRKTLHSLCKAYYQNGIDNMEE